MKTPYEVVICPTVSSLTPAAFKMFSLAVEPQEKLEYIITNIAYFVNSDAYHMIIMRVNVL